MMSEDSYQVLKESYDNACLNAKDFRNKYEHGVASEYDVLRAEVQVRTLEPGLLQAENGVKLSKVNLKVLLGLDMNIEVTPANKLSDYEADMYEQALNIDTSLQNNTNLKQLDLQADYLKKALVVQKMSWYPTLTATDLYNWTSMSNGPIFKDFRWNPYSMIGLTLSIPIFQGGSRVRYDFYGCRNWRRLRDVAFYGYDSCLRIICVNVDYAGDRTCCILHIC